MKKAEVVFLVMIIAVLFCGCGKKTSPSLKQDDYENDSAYANAKFEIVLDALRERSTEKIKALFAKNAISASKTFDEDLNKLFGFYSGSYVTHKDWDMVNVDSGMIAQSYGEYKCLSSSYDITTSENTYRLAIYEYTVYSSDENNIGIWSIHITKSDGTETDLPYYGDVNIQYGINIEA